MLKSFLGLLKSPPPSKPPAPLTISEKPDSPSLNMTSPVPPSPSSTGSSPLPRTNSKLNISRPQPDLEAPKPEAQLSPKITKALADLYFDIEAQFDLSTERLVGIKDALIKSMNYGLANDDGDLAMIPTFVSGRPTGEEVGSFFAIDLGGSNLRICLVSLKGCDQDIEVAQRKYVVPEKLKASEAKDLFDYIAGHVENFLLEHRFQPSRADKMIPLGFTFSFPVTQTAIDRGKLVMWNKGFTCPGAVGKDVVKLLQDALDRRLLNIKVAAMVNDTVGTLLASAYVRPNSLAGVIFGTGTNAAYYEKLSHIKKWRGDPELSDEMILNIEWGNFDSEKHIIPCTVFDHRLDRLTQNPYKMVLEKMISGRYLGEIVRHILLELIDHRALFGGRSTPILNTPYQFHTSYLSEISADSSSTLVKARHILEEILGLKQTTQTERETVRGLCHFVARRSARLSAAILAGVIEKRGDLLESDITVGVDGSLFEHHPSFHQLMAEALRELMGDKASLIHLTLARDGSGIGAALTAMIASQ